METEVIEVLPLDRLAKIYRKMRSAIEVLTKEYDTQVESIKEQQEGVKNAMKDQMKALGVTSVKTAEGTVILSVKTRYNTQDWDSFKRFIIENEAVDLPNICSNPSILQLRTDATKQARKATDTGAYAHHRREWRRIHA